MKRKPAPIEVSFAPCPRCSVPHNHAEDCERAEIAEIQIRSARSFTRPQKTKRVRIGTETRTRLSRGDHPRLMFPFDEPCPVEQGDVIQITALLWIGVTTIGRALDHWVVDYIEHNERPRLLRQLTHSADFDAMRERNEGKIDAIKDASAAEESGYTSSTGSSMAAEPEAISREDAEHISEQSRRDHLAQWETDQQQMREIIARLRDNPAAGKRGSELKFLETQLDRIDTKVRRGQSREEAA